MESLTLFEELKSTVHKISSKQGGKTNNESITLDILISGSMSPTTFETQTYDDFRHTWGVQFDFNTLKRRLERKLEFEGGDLGALVDESKWENSGHAWDDDAIDLFRSFYELPSPAIYLDTLGRKVNFTNFDDQKDYDFLYGINCQSNVYYHRLTITNFLLC